MASLTGVGSGAAIELTVSNGQVDTTPLNSTTPYWLFTPELQWQSRGQMAYLTGLAMNANGQGMHWNGTKQCTRCCGFDGWKRDGFGINIL